MKLMESRKNKRMDNKRQFIFIFGIVMSVLIRDVRVCAEILDQAEFKDGGGWENDCGIIIPDYECDLEPYHNSFTESGNIADGYSESDEVLSAENRGLIRRYDPRDYGLVTEIKDQGKLPLCWAYSAISTMESSLIRSHLTDESVDISEPHSVFFSYEMLKEKGGIKPSVDLTGFCNTGGNPGYVWEIIKDGIGPVEEADTDGLIMLNNISGDMSVSCNGAEYETLKMRHIARLKGIYSIEAYDISDIKSAITECGAVNMCYYSNPHYYRDQVNDRGDSSYYMPYETGTKNHAVSIIGWDDDFPATAFEKGNVFIGKTYTNADESADDNGLNYDVNVDNLPNGAWLVKNSFGKRGYKSPEGSGFYWISYYDRTLTDMTAVIFDGGDMEKEQIQIRDDKVSDPDENVKNDVDSEHTDLKTDNKSDETENKESVKENGKTTDMVRIESKTDVRNVEYHHTTVEVKVIISRDLTKQSVKKKKRMVYKKGGVTYEIINGRAKVAKISGHKRKIRIPKRIRFKGKTYPVTGFKKSVLKKMRKIIIKL